MNEKIYEIKVFQTVDDVHFDVLDPFQCFVIPRIGETYTHGLNEYKVVNVKHSKDGVAIVIE